ncbi:MAG TPA: hypothetical protein VEB22_08805, partial [Phycisphaerales bacterium]|nr:hypothetical protein [Phycisphaerales bacterium]
PILSEERWKALRVACEGDRIAAVSSLPTGWDPIDRTLPGHGLSGAKIHEWIGVASDSNDCTLGDRWIPPLSILLSLAHRAATSAGKSGGYGEDRENGKPQGRLLLWIGERVWPFPGSFSVQPDGSHLSRSIFVRAEHPGERLWAADLALRSGAAAAVIADGSRLDLSATRRLQLAAEAGGGFCFLARPPWERAELSAAATRWYITTALPVHPAVARPRTHAPVHSPTRRWTVELLRCKGVQPSTATTRRWILEEDRETRHGLVAAELLDRPGEAAPAQRRSG